MPDQGQICFLCLLFVTLLRPRKRYFTGLYYQPSHCSTQNVEGRTNPLNHSLSSIVWVWFRMFLKFKLRLVWCFALQSYSPPSPFVAPLSSEVGAGAMCCIWAFATAAKQINLFQRCNMEDYCAFYFYGTAFASFHSDSRLHSVPFPCLEYWVTPYMLKL